MRATYDAIHLKGIGAYSWKSFITNYTVCVCSVSRCPRIRLRGLSTVHSREPRPFQVLFRVPWGRLALRDVRSRKLHVLGDALRSGHHMGSRLPVLQPCSNRFVLVTVGSIEVVSLWITYLGHCSLSPLTGNNYLLARPRIGLPNLFEIQLMLFQDS